MLLQLLALGISLASPVPATTTATVQLSLPAPDSTPEIAARRLLDARAARDWSGYVALLSSEAVAELQDQFAALLAVDPSGVRWLFALREGESAEALAADERVRRGLATLFSDAASARPAPPSVILPSAPAADGSVEVSFRSEGADPSRGSRLRFRQFDGQWRAVQADAHTRGFIEGMRLALSAR